MNYVNNSTNDYYNYNNNLYNAPSYNQNDAKTMIYNPYQGYIRGNMFPNLYNSYKVNTPYEIEPLNEQAEVLTKLNALDFSLRDISLYLDIYSGDKNMIELYNQYLNEKNMLTNEYERKYGAICLNSPTLNKVPWAWDGEPWPWER